MKKRKTPKHFIRKKVIVHRKKESKESTEVIIFLHDLLLADRKLLFLFAIALLTTLFISQNGITLQNPGFVFGEHTTLLAQPLRLPDPSFYPKKITDVPAPDISAQAAIVLDVTSAVVLLAKNQDTMLLPASTTKIMTALVAMDYFQPGNVLIVPKLTATGSKMDLVVSEQITFENLLYGLLLNSGNDAAETLAKDSPAGYDGFIAAMNKKATALNLRHTHFSDVAGLATENHYTTALDLARLASFALKNELLAKIVATKNTTVTDVSGEHVHHLENLNKLLGEVAGVTGMKTGFTQEAGQVLVAAASRDGHIIVTVVLKSSDRFTDSKNLLEWAFGNFTYVPAF